MTLVSVSLRAVIVAIALGGSLAWASSARAAPKPQGGVPYLDVKGSCADAQKFGAQGQDKDVAYKGCMQDEMAAKSQLAKRWSSFKSADKQTCVEQARQPSPSYVEVLTCLEMDTDGMNAGGGKGHPQIGGPTPTGLPKTDATSDAPK